MKNSDKAIKYARLFLYSYWAIVAIFTVTLFTTILTLLAGILFPSEGGPEMGVLIGLTVIAFVSSMLGLIGDVLLHRNNRFCFYFYFGFIAIYIINVAWNGLWYETMVQCLMLGIVFMAFISWGRPEKEKNILSITRFELGLILTAIVAATCFLGLVMMGINPLLAMPDPYPYLDAFISVTFFAGWIMMIRKIFQSYIVYVICTIATIALSIIFAVDGSYYYLIYTGTNLCYLFFYAVGSSNWYQIIKEQKDN